MVTQKKSKYPIVEFRKPEPLQDYYKDSDGSFYSVARLIDDCRELEIFDCPVAALDISHKIWGDCCMLGLAQHCKKVMDADLNMPIIIAWDGYIADGRHRIIKAIIQGRSTIKAVRMMWKPEPCRKGD